MMQASMGSIPGVHTGSSLTLAAARASAVSCVAGRLNFPSGLAAKPAAVAMDSKVRVSIIILIPTLCAFLHRFKAYGILESVSR